MKTMSLECPKQVRKSLTIPSSRVPLNEVTLLLEGIKNYASQISATITVGFTVFDANGEDEIQNQFKINADSTMNLLLLLRQVLSAEQYVDYPRELKEEFLEQVQADLQVPPSKKSKPPEEKANPWEKRLKKKKGAKKKLPKATFILVMLNSLAFAVLLFFVGDIMSLPFLKMGAFALPVLALVIFFLVWFLRKGKIPVSENEATTQEVSVPLEATPAPEVAPSFQEPGAFPPLPEAPEAVSVPPKRTVPSFPAESETNVVSPPPVVAAQPEVVSEPPVVEEQGTTPVVEEDTRPSVPQETPPDSNANPSFEPPAESLERKQVIADYTNEATTDIMPDFTVQATAHEAVLHNTPLFKNEGLSAKEWRSERLRQLEQHVMELKRKDGVAIEQKEKELDNLPINSRADGVKAMLLIEEIARMKLDLEKKWE